MTAAGSASALRGRHAAVGALLRMGALVSVLVSMLVSAWPAIAVDERARIASERREIELRFDAELARCSERFAVTSCKDDVRARKREALAGLRAQELVLDDAERKRRAVRRMQAIERKRIEAESRPVQPAGPEPVLRAPRSASAPAEPASQAPKTQPDHTAAEAADAARRAAAAEQLRSQATEDRARIERRQAERARKGKPSAPLPTPPEAASGAAPR